MTLRNSLLLAQSEEVNQSMQTIGEIFKTEREKRQLSPKDIETRTGIRAVYITAIENGEYARTPGEVFLKGFIRTYAISLQLSPEVMLDLYRCERPPEPVAETVHSPALGKKAFAKKRRKWGHALAAIAAVAIVGYSVYRISSPAVLTVAREDKPAVVQEKEKNSGLTSPVSSGVIVTVVFSERCWLQVLVDGKETFEGLMEPGQTATWQGRDAVEMHLGNAGAADIQVNHQAIGKLGASGDVVQKVFRTGGK